MTPKRILIILLVGIVTWFAVGDGANAAQFLRQGSTGPAVTELQIDLNDAGWPTKVDGNFGARTDRTVRAFQRANGLRVDGIVGPVTLTALDVPARATQPAVRGPQTQLTPPPAPGGLNGLPFAPSGLSACAEARFYANQFGLESFPDSIIWRESNCRNDVTSNTGCCRGYVQLDFNLHLRDHRLGPRYRENCQVFQISDGFGNLPLQKQKHMCAARQLRDVVGMSAWNL